MTSAHFRLEESRFGTLGLNVLLRFLVHTGEAAGGSVLVPFWVLADRALHSPRRVRTVWNFESS